MIDEKSNNKKKPQFADIECEMWNESTEINWIHVNDIKSVILCRFVWSLTLRQHDHRTNRPHHVSEIVHFHFRVHSGCINCVWNSCTIQATADINERCLRHGNEQIESNAATSVRSVGIEQSRCGCYKSQSNVLYVRRLSQRTIHQRIEESAQWQSGIVARTREYDVMQYNRHQAMHQQMLGNGKSHSFCSLFCWKYFVDIQFR